MNKVEVVYGLLLVVPSIMAGGCTFTHSLNNLQGGIADASASDPDVQRVEGDGSDARDGNNPDADAGLVYPPRPIDITGGDNHFSESETFPTSTFAYKAYVAWNRDTFYFGVLGASVESNDPATWILAYWGTAAASGTGTRNGQTYGNQTPTLNFEANYHLRWKGDNTFISLMRYRPGGWQDGGAFAGRVERRGQFVEFSVPLKAIFAPGDAATGSRFVLTVIHDSVPEKTYASVPASAVVCDGMFNPPYEQSFDFDLTGGALPNQHQAQ